MDHQPTTTIDLMETEQPPAVNGVSDYTVPPPEPVPEISTERREELEQEMAKLEEEMNTLKQAMMRKERQLADIRTELGITRWSRIQNSEAMNKSKQVLADATKTTSQALADATKTTGQALKEFGTATANKWTEIKESPRMQTASERFWATTDMLKGKIVGERKAITGEPPAAQIVVTPDN